jgi:hypothetical protein
MNAFLSKSLSDNRKPVLSTVEGSAIQNRKLAGIVAIVLTLAMCVAVAQAQPKKVPRIGYLSPVDPVTDSTLSEPFGPALRELGYTEGQNIVIEYRHAEGKPDRLPVLATDLVRLKVDPRGQECDQDDSHRYHGPGARSCRGRPS